MSCVVNNNRGFLQLLAECPVLQRQFLLKTATPQQLHSLVQVLYNILRGHISIPEENKRVLQSYKDALPDLARPNVPYKTNKRVLVQGGSGFIKDFIGPCCFKLRISNAIKEMIHRKVDHSKLRLPPVLMKMKRKIDLVEEEHGSEHEESESSGDESEDEDPRIKDVLSHLSRAVSEKRASDLLHSLTACRGILLWTPRVNYFKMNL